MPRLFLSQTAPIAVVLWLLSFGASAQSSLPRSVDSLETYGRTVETRATATPTPRARTTAGALIPPSPGLAPGGGVGASGPTWRVASPTFRPLPVGERGWW